MTPPWLIALALVVGLIVLVPARRLQLAGLSSTAIGSYALILWLAAMVVAIAPAATRVLIPILLIAYVAPFVAAPDTVRRVLRRPTAGGPASAARRTARPPVKNVTPPDVADADEPSAGSRPPDDGRP